MFDSGIERTVTGTAIALWFAHGWYLNTRLQAVHRKVDLVPDNFGGLRDYLYENDPQFDDERDLLPARVKVLVASVMQPKAV